MSHSYSKIWIHAVFATKNRQPVILPTIIATVHGELRQQLITTGCYVDSVGGIADHVHLLFLLNPKIAIADVLRQTKGGSSHVFNQQGLTLERFAWQTGYSAFSVSEGHLARVRHYIQNQEEHHRSQTSADEHQQFMRHYGLLDDSDTQR